MHYYLFIISSSFPFHFIQPLIFLRVIVILEKAKIIIIHYHIIHRQAIN